MLIQRKKIFFKSLLVNRLDLLTVGSILLEDEAGKVSFGSGSPRVHLIVKNDNFYRKVALGGSVGAGESFMAGDWECDNLVDLVRLFVLNFDSLNRLDGFTASLNGFLNLMEHIVKRNNRTGSRRNIADHYDLSNDFFETFLDSRMMYSSAVFENPNQTLEEASLSKLKRLASKLDLSSQDHVLEIGSGWGGFAIYASKNFGCRVTTTTISEEQYRIVIENVVANDLSDKVTVLKKDYRDLTGIYDRVVSIEMVEAVGHQYLPTYFEIMSRLLKPDGLLVLQAITIDDRKYKRALRSVDFIKKHIFPGSFIPCISELISVSARKTDTILTSLEDIGFDYAKTLQAWRERLVSNESKILSLGFDEQFMRKWIFYLAYCEGGFRERSISDVQLIFSKPKYRGKAWRKSLND